MKTSILLLFTLLCSHPTLAQSQSPMDIELQAGELIWSGVIKDGDKMPLTEGYRFDFYANNQSNQIQPLLLSNQGLYVWSEAPFAFEIRPGKRQSAETGDPIVASLEYVFPNQGYERIHDQFMLGDTTLVAPMTKKGYSRQVTFPPGIWTDDRNRPYQGGKTLSIEVPLDTIPVFKRISQ